jgi:S1-C subfamily serine protease
VKQVSDGSAAHAAGFRAGDVLVSLAGQPLLSIADVQFVLHNAGHSANLPARVRRDGLEMSLTLKLAPGWRTAADISWRATTWDLRRMATGGLLLEDMSDEQRRELRISGDALALHVKHVGQYGEHATAKNAGFQQGDVIVGLNGSASRLNETQFVARVLGDKQPGEKITLNVRRGQRELTFTMPVF